MYMGRAIYTRIALTGYGNSLGAHPAPGLFVDLLLLEAAVLAAGSLARR